jgi:hypothetical protein
MAEVPGQSAYILLEIESILIIAEKQRADRCNVGRTVFVDRGNGIVKRTVKGVMKNFTYLFPSPGIQFH